MLRRARDVRVAYEPLPYLWGWLVFHVGDEHFRVKRIDKAEFRALVRWADEVPQRIAIVDRYACWMYRRRFFWDNVGLNQHEVHNLLKEVSVVA